MANHLTWKLVDETAADLGAGESARLKWRQTGRGVPPVWQIKIARELMAQGIPVSLDDFSRLPENPGRVAA
jgi:hypothetical protein